MSVSGSLPQACCTLPPVQADYTPKGTYTDVAGIKSYVSGPEDAKSAVVIVYDIFGLSPQILQGADLLASQGLRVIMPDFLLGKYAQPAWFDGSEEGAKKKAEFFSGFPGAIPTQREPLAKVIKAVKETSAKKIGAVGYCWGWKVIVTSEGLSELSSFAGAHPSFIAEDDAENIKIPVCLLPSSAEDMSIIKVIYDAAEKVNPGKSFMKQYPSEPHGWLAARGDLSGNDHTKNFEDGYTNLSTFFKGALA